MTIQEVKAAQAALELQITQLVQAFEQQTACTVHSIPVNPATQTAPANVRVKVQV